MIKCACCLVVRKNLGQGLGSATAGNATIAKMIDYDPELNDFLEISAEALASAESAFAAWEAER